MRLPHIGVRAQFQIPSHGSEQTTCTPRSLCRPNRAGAPTSTAPKGICSPKHAKRGVPARSAA
eukprot:7469147-Alexandrium_andersonii.AAC.1